MVYYFYAYLYVLLMLLIFIYTTVSHWTNVYVYITTKYDFRASNPQILQIMMRIKTGGITFHVGNILNMLYRVLASLFHWSFLQLSGKGILSMRPYPAGENPGYKEIKRSALVGYS